MDEYIKREEAIEAAKHAWAKGLEPSQYIDIIQVADVSPVRHGRWEKAQDMRRMDGNIYDYRCSLCNSFAEKGVYNNYDRLTNYCPACGARMDLGGGKNDTTDI